MAPRSFSKSLRSNSVHASSARICEEPGGVKLRRHRVPSKRRVKHRQDESSLVKTK